MEHYATVPSDKPLNTAIYQLPAVNVAGSKFYGWKMVYLKTVDTGKKDKSGKAITKAVADESKPVIYDQTTQELINTDNNNNMFIQVLNSLAQQKIQDKQTNSMIINLMNQVAKLKIGENK